MRCLVIGTVPIFSSLFGRSLQAETLDDRIYLVAKVLKLVTANRKMEGVVGTVIHLKVIDPTVHVPALVYVFVREHCAFEVSLKGSSHAVATDYIAGQPPQMPGLFMTK